jgi:50S ribosomal protein L16 3-hydroxylase
MQLVGFDAAAFLHDCWQKQPQLIRNPWDKWVNPLEPDELAGLACEESIESRLVTRRGAEWIAEHGPFTASRFRRFGKDPSTLLVQAVDQQVGAVAALLEPFRFVPNWRIDDVMVSYASEGGGVGPHYDNYDVFLVQGLGKRRWQIGPRCDSAAQLVPHDELRLLADFEPTDEWVLEPGDILYVPPGVAHNGVAIGDDCMTYSIGFRAPSRGELISNWCDEVVEGLSDDDRYGDADLEPAGNPGEIAPGAIDRLYRMVSEKMLDREAFVRWFGQYSSNPKYPDLDWSPEQPVTVAQVQERLRGGSQLCRNPASRFAFVRVEGGSLMLFVDGECFACDGRAAAFAERLCAQQQVALGSDLGGSPAVPELVTDLLNRGSVAFDEDD